MSSLRGGYGIAVYPGGIVFGTEAESEMARLREYRPEPGAFVQALRGSVASICPMADDETLDSYIARVRSSPVVARRALVAACLVSVSRDFERVRIDARSAWIANQRRSFVRGPVEPCRICGEGSGEMHAHHLLPLGLQFDWGRRHADHSSIWLCRDCHVLVHRQIADIMQMEHHSNSLNFSQMIALEDVLAAFRELAGWHDRVSR